MEKTVKQRLIEYLKFKKIGQAKFEKLAHIGHSYINNLKEAPKSAQLEKILSAAPDLNKVWLLTGEGDMLSMVNQEVDGEGNIVAGGNVSHVNNGSLNGQMLTLLAEKDKQIAEKDKQIASLQQHISELISIIKK